MPHRLTPNSTRLSPVCSITPMHCPLLYALEGTSYPLKVVISRLMRPARCAHSAVATAVRSFMGSATKRYIYHIYDYFSPLCFPSFFDSPCLSLSVSTFMSVLLPLLLLLLLLLLSLVSAFMSLHSIIRTLHSHNIQEGGCYL